MFALQLDVERRVSGSARVSSGQSRRRVNSQHRLDVTLYQSCKRPRIRNAMVDGRGVLDTRIDCIAGHRAVIHGHALLPHRGGMTVSWELDVDAMDAQTSAYQSNFLKLGTRQCQSGSMR